MRTIKVITWGTVLLLASGCAGKATDNSNKPTDAENMKEQVTFNTDSAMSYIKAQVAFGPRVPGTTAHKAAAEYLAAKMKESNPDTLIIQSPEITMPSGEKVKIANIMGQWGLGRPKRVLLVAHWDTRPFADEDADRANHNRPIDGANDGASGTGALLEIARSLNMSMPPEIGVDILLVDAEDSGLANDEESWCLGTQYWTDHMPYKPTRLPRYAILLDMIGGRDAVFHREYFSDLHARGVVDKIWSAAATSGHANRFPNQTGSALTDDHLFLNRAGIPAIDIVENRNPATGSFNPTWHTMDDNITNIDPATVGIVGQIVLNVLHNEK